MVGTNGVNWITEDCGQNIRALNAGKVIEEFRFHPHDRNHALAASWTNCEKLEEGEKCTIFKELYATENLGKDWKYLTNYVFDFEWGVSKKTVGIKIKVPEERVFITKEDNQKSHQSNHPTRGNWSTNIHLYVSDDFFKTEPKLLIKAGNSIVKTDSYMFVTRSHEYG